MVDAQGVEGIEDLEEALDFVYFDQGKEEGRDGGRGRGRVVGAAAAGGVAGEEVGESEDSA